MNDVLFIIIIIVAFLAAMLGIPYLMTRRAVKQVITIFRKNNAMSESTAKIIDELGLRPRTFLQGMFRSRDYKPQALNFLMRGEIVRTTEDGRIWMSEEALLDSKLERR
ncbi:hypothetical protein ACFLUE_01940 [Chloroflexota bacterium]